MTLKLYHHPFSRAAGVLWTLEEVGQPYELVWVDLMKGEQKADALVRLNPMGKIPVLLDGDVVVTEAAAIALYLADRYAVGRLAPALDDPRRAAYLRWSLFAPSVAEPAALAKQAAAQFKASQVGWGELETVIKTMEVAVANGEYLLGDMFSAADIVFGGTVRFLLRFNLIPANAVLAAYVERLGKRPALQRADARNQAILKEHGLPT